MPTILPIYLSKIPSDKDFIEILIHITESLDSNSNLDSLVDKKMPKIIFKIKKYYIICVQNGKSIDFDMSKIAAKNILVCEIFNKKNWEQEAKKCGYRYLDQVSENWKSKIQMEQLIIQEKKDLKYAQQIRIDY